MTIDLMLGAKATSPCLSRPRYRDGNERGPNDIGNQ